MIAPQSPAPTGLAKTKPKVSRVVFRVAGLYGLSKQSIRFPLNARESIDSGQIAVTLDAEADNSANVGLIDFARRVLTVTYGVQTVFPGLHDLVTREQFDPGLLHPVRAVATDRCEVSPDYRGWHAVGTLHFLAGSIWAGATGG